MAEFRNSYRTLSAGLAAIVGVIAAASAHAAPITWSVFSMTQDGSDVSTNGSVVLAHAGVDLGTGNVVDGTTVDVNGVTFDDGYIFDSPTHLDTIGSRCGIAGGNYRTMQQVADRHGSGTATFTFTNLIRGAQYEIQVWHADNVSTAQDNGMVLNDGGTNSVPTPGTPGHVTLIREVTEGGTGQHAIGTFTADADTQQFLAKAYGTLLTTPSSQANVTINGVQLRLTYTPPRGTVIVVR